MGELFQIGTSLVASAEGGHEGPSFWGLMAYIVLMIAIMLVFMSSAKAGLNTRVFKKWTTQWSEQAYLFIENMVIGTIGEHGRKYMAFILTFWVVIFTGNIIALFFPTSPTADLSFNLGMAFISIGYVQYEGVKANGLFGHLKHFSGPKLGGPLVIISGMIFLIEIFSELMKNVSLSLRLFGNIHGGHMAVESMNELGGHYIPVGAFLLPIKLLTCLVQAMIFSLLTCVYLSLVTHHSDEGHAEHGHEMAPAH